jgi:methyltransferase (TIGR00027 family)
MLPQRADASTADSLTILYEGALLLMHDAVMTTQERVASRTALGTAYMRAAHQLIDAQPRVLDDPAVLPLLGPDAEREIRDQLERYQQPAAKGLRSHVVLRSRFAEDRLAAAVGRGVTQYVILGAGLDTFALRQPQWARTLRIFEVDHEQTQSFKRGRIASANLAVPANVEFVTVDFERESLRDGLLRNGVSLQQPTFFSWLGVTMYLKEAATDAVLQSVASFPSGSEIVLTFTQQPDSSSDPGSAATEMFAARAASLGEPFISFYSPETMATKLRGAGFSRIEFLTPDESATRYFNNRPRDLPVPQRTAIVSAMV